MMNRKWVVLLLAILLAPACSGLRKARSTTKAQSPSSSDGAGSAYASAVAKLDDACPLMPPDLVQRLVPRANAPTMERYPLRCTVRNDLSALEITFDTGPDEPVPGAEFVAGLAKGGYLERLDPHDRGDIYLTVILGKDENDINRNLHVEVAGHDGKDHKDDAIAIARAVLAKLKP